MSQPKTIDALIEQMNAIIDQCIQRKSKLGYFAVLYRDVTVQVKEKIALGSYFEDNARMEQLDIVFAMRYIDAIQAYWQDEQPSKSWLAAFEASKSASPMILQHLLLGMNAHINLDLGIATALVAPGEKINAIKTDFDKIMDLLTNMIDGVQDRIKTVSPAFGWIDYFGGKTDEKVAGFVIHKARDLAWTSAKHYAQLSENSVLFNQFIHTQDEIVTKVANGILKLGFIVSLCFRYIAFREEKDVVKVIRSLMFT